MEKRMGRMEILTLAVAIVAASVEVHNRLQAWKLRKATAGQPGAD